jgi:hypothetical protein
MQFNSISVAGAPQNPLTEHTLLQFQLSHPLASSVKSCPYGLDLLLAGPGLGGTEAKSLHQSEELHSALEIPHRACMRIASVIILWLLISDTSFYFVQNGPRKEGIEASPKKAG